MGQYKPFFILIGLSLNFNFVGHHESPKLFAVNVQCQER
jgi:hypothetical protein